MLVIEGMVLDLISIFLCSLSPMLYPFYFQRDGFYYVSNSPFLLKIDQRLVVISQYKKINSTHLIKSQPKAKKLDILVSLCHLILKGKLFFECLKYRQMTLGSPFIAFTLRLETTSLETRKPAMVGVSVLTGRGKPETQKAWWSYCDTRGQS